MAGGPMVMQVNAANFPVDGISIHSRSLLKQLVQTGFGGK
jgi:hypothetical protein